MIKRIKKLLPIISLFILIGIFSGCGTIVMEANSKMTQSIFFQNLKPKKVIFIQVRNTTTVDSTIAKQVEDKLFKKGYMFTDDPSKAQYILQINTLNMNQHQEQNSVKAMTAGAATAGTIKYAATRSDAGAVQSGIVVGVAAGLLAYATADGNVRMQTDVLITEKLLNGDSVKHRTRILAEATQMHLTVKEAQPILEKKISTQIAGIF